MSSLSEHLNHPDFRSLCHDPRMGLLDGYLAELEGIYHSAATDKGDTDYAKGQWNAICSLRKDLANMQLDTEVETGKLDT